MKYWFILVLLFIGSGIALCQTSEFQYKDVEEFLQRMETKGLLPLSPYNHFLTQSEQYSLLCRVDTTRLTKVENEKLHYLLHKEFSYNKANSLVSNNIVDGLKSYIDNNKVELFDRKDSLFSLRIRPAINLQLTNAYGEKQQLEGWGWSMMGRIGENVEFRMDFMDNSLTAKKYDYTWELTNTPGRIYSRKSNGNFQFSETNGSMLYHNSFITIGLTKEKMELGSGIRGQFVLSDKAPSFPAFYMKLSPADWINIYSMHGWLLSNITDSVNSYQTEMGLRSVEYSKYFVMHAIQVYPVPEVSITAGETIIYSDRSIYAGYFIPFLFYRSVDHQFTYGSGESGNNGSFFVETSVRPCRNLTTFFSLYLDEFSLTDFLKGSNNRNQFGYTIGLKSYPLSEGNLELDAEYTKILPWVYSNWIPTQTYRNSDYILGHYIGQNADQLYVELKYTPTSRISLKLYGEAIRKGGYSDIKNQYNFNIEEPFLYGPRLNETSVGLDCAYEVLVSTYLRVEVVHSKITDQDATRTPLWMQGSHNSMSVGLSHGF